MYTHRVYMHHMARRFHNSPGHQDSLQVPTQQDSRANLTFQKSWIWLENPSLIGVLMGQSSINGYGKVNHSNNAKRFQDHGCTSTWQARLRSLRISKLITVMVKFATGWHVVIVKRKVIFDTWTPKFFPKVSKSSFLRIQKHTIYERYESINSKISKPDQRFVDPRSTANSELGWQWETHDKIGTTGQ